MCHLHSVISLPNARTILYTVLSRYTMPAPYCTQCYLTTQCQHHIVHSVISLHNASTILYTVLSHYTMPASYCTQCYLTTQCQHHIVHSVISLHNASIILYTVLSHYTMPAPYCTQCYLTTQCQHHIVHSVISLHNASTILYTVLSHYTLPAPYCTPSASSWADRFARFFSSTALEMKDTFQAFPEMILLDATYKLNDLRMPLYVMLVVDGNGESEVVALWFVRNEDHATLSRIMKVYAVYIAHKHTHVHTQTI